MPLFRPTPLPQQRRPAPLRTLGATVSEGEGTAAGTSTVIGVGRALATGVGSAAGTSTASAVAVSNTGVGAAAGTSTALGVGAALGTGVGAASGTSTALGVGSTGSIFPLTVSADGRYLMRNDGVPFLICADSTWSMAVNLTLTEVEDFLDTITGQGFNTVMLGNTMEHRFTVVAPPKNRAGLLPFTKRLDGNTFTGSPSGTTGASGTQGQFSADNYSNINTQAADWTFPDEDYWLFVESILDACLERDVLVFVWPAYLGFHNNDEGWLNEMVVLDGITGAGGFTGEPFADANESKLWNYGAWLADRWKAYPHIVWVMGGDYGSNDQTLNAAQDNAVNAVMDGLKSVPDQLSLLYTAHWDRPCKSTDTPLDHPFDLNFAYSGVESAEVTRDAYADSPVIPAVFGEGYYEDSPFGGTDPWRQYLYWGFLGGIAGGFFGNEQVWRFDDGTPGTDYNTLLDTDATLDASRQFAFWQSKPWWRLRPNGLGGIGTLITAGGGTASPQSTNYVAAAATPQGDLLLAYVPDAHSGSVTIDMTKMAGTTVARWFDPTNATFTAIGVFENTGTQAFTPPANNSAGDGDFLLVLETSQGAAAGTSTVTGVGRSLASGTGSAAGTSTAAATGSSLAVGVGSASGTSTALGVAIGAATGEGAAAGTSTVSGVGKALATSVGASAGSSTAAAVGSALGTGVGGGAGTSTATGTGAALATGVGSASGTSTALGVGSSVGTGPGVGAAAGTSTALGVGSALATGVGIAAGTSTALGVWPGGGDPVSVMEDAIYGWVLAGSGLAADHVIWGAEATGGGPIPTGTFISMRIIAINRVSDDWIRLVTAGDQIEHHVRGTRHPTLELTCFAGDRYGANRAAQILERVLTSIRLPSIAAALKAAGLGVGVRGRVRVVTGARSTMFDPRAIVEIGLHTTIDISETGYGIERVNAETPGLAAFWVPEPPE